MRRYLRSIFFFFNDTATPEIYTLSLHDALPIFAGLRAEHESYAQALESLGLAVERLEPAEQYPDSMFVEDPALVLDRKSTRLNSSHGYISYAVFCLKKKKKNLSTQLTDLTTDTP